MSDCVSLRWAGVLMVLWLVLGACEVETVPISVPGVVTAAPTVSPTPMTVTVASTATPTLIPLARGELPLEQFQQSSVHGVAGGASIGDGYIPELGNTGYDVQHYTLDFAIDPVKEYLDATATLSATATLDQLGRLSLDFIGYEIRSVMVDGQWVPFARDNHKLYVDLPQPVAEGDAFAIEIVYDGPFVALRSKWAPAALGFRKPLDNHVLAFSEPDGSRAWYPSNDHPLDKATFAVRITVPAPLMGVSNGELVATTEADGQRSFDWEMRSPMATYLLALVVGEYVEVVGEPFGEIPVRHYLFQEEAEAVAQRLAVTDEVLAFFEALIGPYPFDHYGHVEVRLPGLAMETQTMVLMDARMLQPDIVENVVAHEAVHHWFGNSVTPGSWADIWLNEGFASYLALMWQYRDNPEVLEDQLGGMEQTLIQRADAENFPLDEPIARFMFSATTYTKGAWVVHLLRQELGEDGFRELLRRYYQKHAGANVTTEDLRVVAEEVSGRDLGLFFDQWVGRPGLPRLATTWVANPVEGGQVQVNVQVCQTRANVFTTPLSLVFEGPGTQVAQETLMLDGVQTRYTTTLPFTPTQTLLDPDQHLLAQTDASAVAALVDCPQ